jgi:hypothetical protein
MLLIALDESAETAMTSALSGRERDVVVIGGGIRKPEPLLPLFEQAVNLVRRYAPKAAIAFNTGGGDVGRVFARRVAKYWPTRSSSGQLVGSASRWRKSA